MGDSSSLSISKVVGKIENHKKIIGIDPGTNILGYSIVKVANKKCILESAGIVNLQKFEDPYTKLKIIYERLSSIIISYAPDEMAVESPFYGKNIQSMLKLGRAQGVVIACAMMHDVPVTEYYPKKIKQSITGNGNASKEQVAAMLKQLLSMDTLPKYLDATDALGAAICHHLNTSRGNYSKNNSEKFGSWDQFLKANPNRIKK
ncbi:UNVERIFIED_CONTAM: hypothetical protein GTU68_054151 [Idotea baltica]|nr:hypothetical protein [Idotea baltica]